MNMTQAVAGDCGLVGGGGGKVNRLIDPRSSSKYIWDSSLAGLTAAGVVGVGGCDWFGVIACSVLLALGGCRGGRNAGWGGGR